MTAEIALLDHKQMSNKASPWQTNYIATTAGSCSNNAVVTDQFLHRPETVTSFKAPPQQVLLTGLQDTDVIIGRGPKSNNHPGNKLLCRIVNSMLEEYTAAKSKHSKTDILSRIVTKVRMNGRFIKEDARTGQWFDVGDFAAREKIARLFRNALHSNYKSSTESKRRKRQGNKKSSSATSTTTKSRTTTTTTKKKELSIVFHSEVKLELESVSSLASAASCGSSSDGFESSSESHNSDFCYESSSSSSSSDFLSWNDTSLDSPDCPFEPVPLGEISDSMNCVFLEDFVRYAKSW